VRKKRTFIKRDEAAPSADEPAEPVVSDADLARREEEAQAQALQLPRTRSRARREAPPCAKSKKRATRPRLRACRREKAGRRCCGRRSRGCRCSRRCGLTTKPVAGAKPAAAAEAKPAEAPAAAAAPEVVKPALRVIKAADVVDEEKVRAADLAKRRKAAEDEAHAIRAMMNAPKEGAGRQEARGAAEAGRCRDQGHDPQEGRRTRHDRGHHGAKPGDKKAVKSEKLSSSWADDAKKRSALKPGARSRRTIVRSPGRRRARVAAAVTARRAHARRA